MTREGNDVRIAFITQMYPPDRLGHAARVHDTVRAMADLGGSVTIVAPPPTFPWGIHPRQRKRRVVSVEDGITNVRLWSWQPRTPDPHFVPRLAYYLVFAVHAFFWCLWNRRRYDVLMSATPPVFALLPGRILRMFSRRLVTVVDVHDLWVDAAIAIGFISPRSPTTRLSRWLETSCFRHADLVAVTTPHMARTLEARGVKPEQVVWLPNGVDSSRFTATASGPSLPRFIFTGNIGHAADLETVIRGLALVHKTHPEATLALTGDGDTRPALEALTKEEGLQGAVTFHGMVEPEERARLVAGSRAGVAMLLRLPSLDYLVPTKAYEYLATGVPFLGAHGIEVEALAVASGGGRLAENTPESVAEAMRWFLDHPKEARAMGERGRSHVLEHYDRAMVARRLLEAVARAAEVRRAG